MGIILKYMVVSVAAKMSLKFRGSTTEIPKYRSKLTKYAIFDLFWLFGHKALFSCWMGFVGNT